MNKILNFFIAFFLVVAGISTAIAGNPDRQGESGAAQLLLNPYPMSAGLHTMTTSMVGGVEAMQINVAGLSRITKTQIQLGQARYLVGTDIRLNVAGIAQRVGDKGVLGISLMSVDFGDINVTTTDQPEGTGNTFSPNFFNLGIGYSHTFENKVSVGFLFRGVSEAIADVSSFGFGLDAGVQYVTGENDNFRFGIALRNIGSRMTFGGEGLSTQGPVETDGTYELTFDQRSADFELPSMLNIGLSYDFLFAEKHRLTVLGNFTSNSFSQDQLGGGLEYSLNDFFMLRGGYRYEIGSEDDIRGPIYTGPCAGATLALPLGKDTPEKKASRLAIDYAYRSTKVWDGTHNIGIRISI
ncbi:MAG TPA: PorV/PorQ family protein [Saprospiraceae bacterium]|nr:PorV/PorQ family protein [Saprospiraceae bacterium]HMQ84780.1 PorV/PorQ family protein [Saprospiraceae bacterium]